MWCIQKCAKSIDKYSKQNVEIIFASSKNSVVKIEENFFIESILFNYKELSDNYSDLSTNTRFKTISLPKRHKKISIKKSITVAYKFYNSLPHELK